MNVTCPKCGNDFDATGHIDWASQGELSEAIKDVVSDAVSDDDADISEIMAKIIANDPSLLGNASKWLSAFSYANSELTRVKSAKIQTDPEKKETQANNTGADSTAASMATDAAADGTGVAAGTSDTDTGDTDNIAAATGASPDAGVTDALDTAAPVTEEAIASEADSKQGTTNGTSIRPEPPVGNTSTASESTTSAPDTHTTATTTTTATAPAAKGGNTTEGDSKQGVDKDKQALSDLSTISKLNPTQIAEVGLVANELKEAKVKDSAGKEHTLSQEQITFLTRAHANTLQLGKDTKDTVAAFQKEFEDSVWAGDPGIKRIEKVLSDAAERSSADAGKDLEELAKAWADTPIGAKVDDSTSTSPHIAAALRKKQAAEATLKTVEAYKTHFGVSEDAAYKKLKKHSESAESAVVEVLEGSQSNLTEKQIEVLSDLSGAAITRGSTEAATSDAIKRRLESTGMDAKEASLLSAQAARAAYAPLESARKERTFTLAAEKYIADNHLNVAVDKLDTEAKTKIQESLDKEADAKADLVIGALSSQTFNAGSKEDPREITPSKATQNKVADIVRRGHLQGKSEDEIQKDISDTLVGAGARRDTANALAKTATKAVSKSGAKKTAVDMVSEQNKQRAIAGNIQQGLRKEKFTVEGAEDKTMSEALAREVGTLVAADPEADADDVKGILDKYSISTEANPTLAKDILSKAQDIKKGTKDEHIQEDIKEIEKSRTERRQEFQKWKKEEDNKLTFNQSASEPADTAETLQDNVRSDEAGSNLNKALSLIEALAKTEGVAFDGSKYKAEYEARVKDAPYEAISEKVGESTYRTKEGKEASLSDGTVRGIEKIVEAGKKSGKNTDRVVSEINTYLGTRDNMPEEVRKQVVATALDAADNSKSELAKGIAKKASLKIADTILKNAPAQYGSAVGEEGFDSLWGMWGLSSKGIQNMRDVSPERFKKPVAEFNRVSLKGLRSVPEITADMRTEMAATGMAKKGDTTFYNDDRRGTLKYFRKMGAKVPSAILDSLKGSSEKRGGYEDTGFGDLRSVSSSRESSMDELAALAKRVAATEDKLESMES